jgi:opacity protein-like surface antigen
MKTLLMLLLMMLLTQSAQASQLNEAVINTYYIKKYGAIVQGVDKYDAARNAQHGNIYFLNFAKQNTNTLYKVTERMLIKLKGQ